MNNQSLKLKNHVSHRSGEIQNQLHTKFGIHFDKIISACMGDSEATKEVGELGRQGRLMSEFAPLIKERAIEAIQGTQVFNESIGEINLAAAASGTAIDKVSDRVDLGNVKFIDDKNLRELDYAHQKNKQILNNENANKYLLLKNAVDIHTLQIDGNYRMLQLELQPEIKDYQLEEAHKIEMAKYNLEKGSKARIDHKPLKQYGGKNIVEKLKQILLGD